jgi:hypothetical protein
MSEPALVCPDPASALADPGLEPVFVKHPAELALEEQP